MIYKAVGKPIAYLSELGAITQGASLKRRVMRADASFNLKKK